MKNRVKIIALILFLVGSGGPLRAAEVVGQGYRSEAFLAACRGFVDGFISFTKKIIDSLEENLIDENGHVVIIPWPYMGEDEREEVCQRRTVDPSMGNDEEELL